MIEQEFWSVIEETEKVAKGSHPVQEAALKRSLSKLDTSEIAAFDRIFSELLNKSYTWDLWGAAYIIDGGCSDDGFEYFRCGLIAAGRDKFEGALRDPESMTSWAEPDEIEFEGIRYVIEAVYKEKSGGKPIPNHGLKTPKKPSGESWDEDSDDLEERFPKLWDKYCA